MATTTENRPIRKSVADTTFDPTIDTSYKSTSGQPFKQDYSNAWVWVVAALVVAGIGIYYFSNYNPPTVATPVITETVTPPVLDAPLATTPLVVTPEAQVTPVAPAVPEVPLAPKPTP